MRMERSSNRNFGVGSIVVTRLSLTFEPSLDPASVRPSCQRPQPGASLHVVIEFSFPVSLCPYQLKPVQGRDVLSFQIRYRLAYWRLRTMHYVTEAAVKLIVWSARSATKQPEAVFSPISGPANGLD
jgi:hypothetical protein